MSRGENKMTTHLAGSTRLDGSRFGMGTLHLAGILVLVRYLKFE